MLKILIIDDHILNHQVLDQYFQNLCDEVKLVHAYNSGQALELLDCPECFDVVLIDYHLQKIDGIETARIISELWPGSKLILHASSAERSIISNYKRLGFEDVLEKPLSVPAFNQFLGKIIN